MRDLVIDTATERLLLGYRAQSGEVRLGNWASQGNHAQDILPRLSELLDGEIPQRVGVALGPGSFTGLRIGLSTAKGLAEGWQTPVWGLDSLGAMSATVNRLYPRPQAAILAAIDARKGRFYGSLQQGDRILLGCSDWEPERWLREVGAQWKEEVLVSGYQGELLAQQWPQLPAGWTALPLEDWTPALLDQLHERALTRLPLLQEAGPEYLRLSEAEELRALSRSAPASPPK